MPLRKRKRRGQKVGKIPLEYIDIREVLDDLGIYYTESGKNVSEGWIGVSCPFCGDSSNHMGLKNGAVTCFKCGTTSNYIGYLAEELNSYGKALDVLRAAVPRELRDFDAPEEKHRVSKVILPPQAGEITKYHAGYLESRGFCPVTLTNHYDLKFCGPIGPWANRIIVPVFRRSRLITHTSIDISDETPNRYKHLSDEESIVPIKHYLYGIDRTNGHICVIVEGLFDMYRIGKGAVCAFGTKVTVEQKKLLAGFREVVIAFDGDDAGRKNAEALGNDLAGFVDVSILDLPEGKDPDSLDESDLNYIRTRIGRGL